MCKHKFVFEVSTKPFFRVSFWYVLSETIVGISCFHIVLAFCLQGRPRAQIGGGGGGGGGVTLYARHNFDVLFSTLSSFRMERDILQSFSQLPPEPQIKE
jgi:hypothetical protein